jgi:hypothetical protein
MAKNKHPSIDRQVQKKGVVSCVFSLGGGQIYKFILIIKIIFAE